MRRNLPLTITAVVGVLYIVCASFTDLLWYRNMFDRWIQVSQGFAIALSCVSLTMIHSRNMRRSNRALYSGTLLVAMYAMIVLGIVNGRSGIYQQIFDNTAGVLEGVVLSCVAFYIVSSSYRAFRLRSVEAGVMMAATVLVMLANVAIGEVIHDQLPLVGRWLMDFPNTAAMRAITIGATLGGAATAVRVIAGLERTYLGGE